MNSLNKWQMQYLSQALTRAKRLEKQREDYYEKVYATILYPSVQLDQSLMREHSHATDAQAIRLIEMQERYDRRIRREYERHVRWQRILEWVNESERIILIRYFQNKKHVHPKIISRILSKIEKRLEQDERRIEQERLEQSIADYRKYEEATKAFRKKKPIEQQDKQRYLINGRFVYMTPEEYAEQR